MSRDFCKTSIYEWGTFPIQAVSLFSSCIPTSWLSDETSHLQLLNLHNCDIIVQVRIKWFCVHKWLTRQNVPITSISRLSLFASFNICFLFIVLDNSSFSFCHSNRFKLHILIEGWTWLKHSPDGAICSNLYLPIDQMMQQSLS